MREESDMRLEDEIKQTKSFKDPYHKLQVNLMFTASWIRNLNTQYFKPYNISPQQYNILRILRGQHPKPASINLLMDRMLDKMSNASRLVEKLRLKGFVARKDSKEDRRKADVVITEKGLDLLEEIDVTMGKLEDDFRTLSVTEVEKLNELLDKMRG